MSDVCDFSGKRRMSGNNVSHSNRKTRRVFKPNVHSKTYVLSSGRKIKVKVCTRVMRTIDKYGIDKVYADYLAQQA